MVSIFRDAKLTADSRCSKNGFVDLGMWVGITVGRDVTVYQGAASEVWEVSENISEPYLGVYLWKREKEASGSRHTTERQLALPSWLRA